MRTWPAPPSRTIGRCCCSAGATVREGSPARRVLTADSLLMLSIFAATVLVSALLLFLVEPMFARMALPLLGGAPAVWNTALVWYQTALLAGYPYAHLL